MVVDSPKFEVYFGCFSCADEDGAANCIYPYRHFVGRASPCRQD